MKSNYHVLIIDPQNDFCDLPEAYRPINAATGQAHAPALPVPGAHADMQRLAAILREGAAGISGVTVTLDSHHRYDVAHPAFWLTATGAAVTPFTQISAASVRAGEYHPRDPAVLERVVAYLDALEAVGRYTLMVWPTHCEIGSWGQNVHEDVRAAYNQWEDQVQASVNKVLKGSNPWTEHYSAVMAEVPDANDPDTQLNQALIDTLAACDTVYITGEAGSHCVKATTEHIADQFGAANMHKLVLVSDCMSPVTGFEAQYHAFVQDMQARGARVANSKEVLEQLQANI